MISLKDVFAKNEKNWVSRFILDEVVIMPLCRTEDDVQYIYSVSNETGSRIWQLIDGRNTVGDIQEAMKKEYRGPGERIERDVLEFIEDVYGEKLINITRPKKQKTAAAKGSEKVRKVYKKPDIAKVKMQPEQAVLTCCLDNYEPKQGSFGFCTLFNFCHFSNNDCASFLSSANDSSSAIGS
ncbi:MAG: PqqD family protein [Candidatus Omnitrophica bacterium]|nr:PqqD family protein [Candidatus Omnitrophota bacterium]